MALEHSPWFWSLILSPVAFALVYWLLRLPSPLIKPFIRPGLASLHGDEYEPVKRLQHLYPESLYDGGDYAELPLGRIKYWVLGQEWGPKLVLISGLAAPSAIWKDVVPALVPHFRLLIYDHYGRGYSDAPDTTYDTMFYLTELALLMQHVKFEKAHILGLSMGGGIAVAFAAHFPSLVEGKIALVAPVGLLSSEHLPAISKLVANRAANWFLSLPLTRRVLLNRYSCGEGEGTLEEIIDLQRLLLPGYLKALGSTVRDGPLRGLQESYAIVGESKLSIFVIWGTHDEVVPYTLATELLRRIPSAKLVTIPGGDHDLTVSRGEATSKLLVDFLKE